MRLICPNCGAQYEVADDVIPTAGRDVQCSNCGHTWFEQPGASEAAEAGEPLPPPPATEIEQEAAAEPEPAPPVPPAAEPTAVAMADDLPPADPPASDPQRSDPLPEETVLASGMARRGLSAGLAEMLREEAEREAAARAAEAPARPPLISPLATNTQRDEDVSLRTARLRGQEPVAPARPASPAARRELLPDIEMINSSLRPTSEQDAAAMAEPATQSRKRGARFGFSTVMLIVAILVGLYIGAPRLSTLVPAAAPVLSRYVAVVNDVRLWIDLKMQAFIADQSAGTPPEPATADPVEADPAAPPASTDAPAPQTPAPATQAPAPQTEAPAAPVDGQTTDQTNG